MDFIKTYFNAEKGESLLFIGVGVVTILISLYCLTNLKKPFYSGLAYPFLILGVIQIAVGTTVFIRSPKDTERVLNYAILEPERINNEEVPRMTAVMKSFVYYRYLELAFIAIGITLMFFVNTSDLLKGVGVGLFIQASIMLTADYFAERRGEIYLKQLMEIPSRLDKQS